MKRSLICIFVICLALTMGSAFAGTLNYIVNPGFEDGTGNAAAPWSYWGGTGGAVANPYVDANNPSARVWSNFGNPTYVNVAAQNNMSSVWLVPGNSYHVRAQYYVPSSELLPGVTARAGIYLSMATAGSIRVLDPRLPDNNVPPTPEPDVVPDQWNTFDYYWVCPGNPGDPALQVNYMSFRMYGSNGTVIGVAGAENPGMYVDNCEFSTPAFGISGTISLNPSADPTGVVVELKDGAGSTVATKTVADSSGAYSFIAVPGIYTVSASKALHETTEIAGVTVLDTDITGQDITLNRLATVKFTGRVIDATTKLGIAGVTVAANVADGLPVNSGPFTTITDSEGTYELEVLDDAVNPIGTYEYYICAGKFPYSPNPSPSQYVDISLGTSPYVMQDIELSKLMPLVDLSATTLSTGAVTTWPNAGSLGGKFVLWGTNTPLVSAVNGVKAATFAAAPMNLVNDEGTACITAPPSIVGTLATDKPMFTLATWIYRATLPSDQNDAGYCSWGPFYYAANYQFSGGGWAADHWGSGNIAYSNIAANAPAGAWHHIVVTSDGTTERVFINGVQNSTAGAPIAFLNAESLRLGAANPIVVGAITNNDANNFWAERSFAGSIQSLQIYDVSMSAEDVASIFSTSTPPVAVTNTISGKVVDGAGTPMDGVTVKLYIAGKQVASYLSGSGGLGAGEYAFNVLADSYQVDASAPLYTKTPAGAVAADATAGNVALADIVLVYRQPVALVDISADDPSVLAGNLTSWTNNGSLGGSFKPRNGTTTVGVADGFKSAIFAGNSNMLLRNAANAFVTLPADKTGNAKWTVSSWVRQAVQGWQVYYSWAAHGDGQGPDNGAASMCWVNDGGQGAFRNRSAGNLGWLNNVVPSMNVWHNLTFTYDGSTLSAYVDGTLNNSKTLSLPMAIPAGQALIIGSRYWNTDGSGSGDYFNGAIARVVMLDDALPSANIASFADSIKPIARYYITVTVTDGVNPVANALVRYAGSAVAVTGADGIAKFGIPVSGQTFEVYADAAGYEASFVKVATPETGDFAYTVALVPNPAEGAISDTFASDLGHWEGFTEFGTERPQGGNDAIGNVWPDPTSGMYNISALAGGAMFQFVQHQIMPGVTYPGGDPAAVTNGTGTITAISADTLEDNTKAWGTNFGGNFDQWGNALQMTVNGKMKRYPIVANTATTITVDSGYDLVADGLAVGATYKIVASVHRWWYPGGIKLTNPLPVTAGSVYNFYYKQLTTGNVSTGRWQLIFTDDAGAVKGTLQLNSYDANTGGVYKQFIPAVQYVAPAGATKVMAKIGTVEGNPLSEYHTRNGAYSFDDIVIDPVVLPVLSGKVTTADGITAISGAAVTISGAAGNIQLTTAADGSYSSIVSPNDTYTVTASKLGFTNGSIQVVVGTASSANNNIALQVPPPQMVSGKVTDQATGLGIANATVYFSFFANATISPDYTATTDTAGDYSIQIPGGTWYVCGVAGGFAPSADLSPALVVGAAPVTGVNIALAANGRVIPAVEKLIFSAVTESFAGANGAATGAWATYMPKGMSLATMGSPMVEELNSVKWEQNLYNDGDGFRFGEAYNAPIPVNGASVVVAVKPIRNAISTSWTSIVDVFYNKLILGIRNDNGNIVVIRNGTFINGPEIPDGQKTVLSLVVQPTGEVKVWANGVEVINSALTSDMTALTPGDAGFMKNINVGRNQPDGWTVFNGNIGDVFLYKTALTDAEREALQADVAKKFDIHVPVFTTLSGKVTLPDGETPIAGAKITCIGNLVTTATTGADGTYSISVEAETYVSISATMENHVMVYPLDGQYDMTVGTTPVANLNFQFTPINTINGIVMDVNGKPINNAVVQIGGIGGPGALTGPDGKYLIAGITIGSVELYADALGYADNTQIIDSTPAASGPFNVDITLTAKEETYVIKNGGFEEVTAGVPNDWTVLWINTTIPEWPIVYTNPVPGNTDIFSATTDCVTGTYAGKYSTSSEWTFFTQEIPVIPGNTYNFYMKLKGDAGVPSIFPMFAFRNDNNDELGGYVSAEAAPYNGWAWAPPTTWTSFLHWNTYGNGLAHVPSLRLTPPAGTTKITVWIGFTDAPAGKAVYADDVVVDRVGPDTMPSVDVASIKALKAQPVGTAVKLLGSKTVTLVPTAEGVFYVGEESRISGLRVVKSGAVLNAGDSVTDLTGTVKKTAGGEIYLELDAIPVGTAGTKLAPLAMNNKAASEDVKALSNLVKVWGKVTVSGSNFTITDGYSTPITVLTDGATLPDGFDGSTAAISGVVSKDDAGNTVILLGGF